MDYQELLFAAEVRKLAGKLVTSDRNKYINEITSDADRDDKLAQWDATHSLTDGLEEAYNRIVDVADQLKSLEEARRSKKLEGNKFAQAAQRPPASTTPSESA